MPVASLISPYGGTLVDLLVPASKQAAVEKEANGLPSLTLTVRQMCDLELLATGAFSPLTSFLGEADYRSVVSDMRLADGTVWPMPITLTTNAFGPEIVGQKIALRDQHNRVLATLDVKECYTWNLEDEAQNVFGTLDKKHPAVAEMHGWGKNCLAGTLRVLHLPSHYDFKELRRTPAETRELLAKSGRENVVAFQTRNPLHRAHEELTKRAQSEIDGALLIHPVVGLTKPGDVDHFIRVRTYKALVENHYDQTRTTLSLLPLAMRMGGPREALWHAIIRRNFGCNHFIVGRDHAGPGLDSNGMPFYGPYDAQELVRKHEAEIGVKLMAFAEMLYLADEDRYEAADKIPAGAQTLNISGTQVRTDYLAKGVALPGWFTRAEVSAVLEDAYPAKTSEGFCLWFTGLPSSGKSTIAEIVALMLLEYGRQSTMLDGDVVRTQLSKGLGFSKEDRDTNILRIGFVASEVVRHNGVAICAAVSPYEATRQQVRQLMEAGEFIEVYVETPLALCEERDLKGLYAKARRGEAKGVTGIDDPYEAPANAEVVVHTAHVSPEEGALQVIGYLKAQGFLE